jgi:hypothetical protein
VHCMLTLSRSCCFLDWRWTRRVSHPLKGLGTDSIGNTGSTMHRGVCKTNAYRDKNSLLGGN